MKSKNIFTGSEAIIFLDLEFEYINKEINNIKEEIKKYNKDIKNIEKNKTENYYLDIEFIKLNIEFYKMKIKELRDINRNKKREYNSLKKAIEQGHDIEIQIIQD